MSRPFVESVRADHVVFKRAAYAVAATTMTFGLAVVYAPEAGPTIICVARGGLTDDGPDRMGNKRPPAPQRCLS